MIDPNEYAFGFDTEQYSSSNINDHLQRLMDWRIAALHDPTVRFVFTRTGISWGFEDVRFKYNWHGIRRMDAYRVDAGYWQEHSQPYPVGRGGYHVLYPSQDAIKQYDNCMKILEGVVDWDHDRLAIDLEVHQGQSKRRITDCTKRFAYAVKRATGRFPLNYSRTSFLNVYTYPEELSFMDNFLAQYLFPEEGEIYAEEFQPPPKPLPLGHASWTVQQTAERGRPIGSPVKKVMDYCRWNGGPQVVAAYFGFDSLPVLPDDVMYVIEMLGNLTVRKGPGTQFEEVPGAFAIKGQTYHATEKENNWYRIEDGWISGWTPWTRVTALEQPQPPQPPQEEHDLAWLIKIHEKPELHP